MAPWTWSASPVRSTAMMPISFCTDAWRMSKLTSGNFLDICQMMGFSTCERVGKVNQQRLEMGMGISGKKARLGASVAGQTDCDDCVAIDHIVMIVRVAKPSFHLRIPVL